MRISDWSSDVCSSDLLLDGGARLLGFLPGDLGGGGRLSPAGEDETGLGDADLVGQSAITFGRLSLALQSGGALFHVAEQLVEAGVVGHAGEQLLLGVLSSGIATRHNGPFPQHPPPSRRIGGYDR